MTLITMQNGSVVMHDGAVGTEVGCCCAGCAGCACDGATIPIGGNARSIVFTAGADAGGILTGDVCTYCMAPHFVYVQTSPVQTTIGCAGTCNYMDIELTQNTSGPFVGTAVGDCLSSGLYRIRLFMTVTNFAECDCANGDFCEYELTGWELLTSDFSDAAFIGDIAITELC